ncbi:hypothetical protein CspeluHIS016_0502860 [Cutaneotrichosporon spelunceum]|uniref:Cns1/TTC4 wheel domain-containing protein n=1 Tax=Cutaneotrichosporon spelunceum TaxID=1672016 RepID=A0AAD3YDS7_9TREE|nr:hypothetical protein CspeluHIS016_0502860 [Cutaneotrichosporon spelunceum]
MADREHDASIDKVLDAMTRAKGDGPREPVTYDEFQKVLDSTPLFMRETPKETEGDYVLEALKSLVFEGEGDEVAINFKNHGNELYAQKSYRDAIDAYTSGLDSGPEDEALRISLLNNRAACNIALKNMGAVLRDTSAIIALAAAKNKDPPSKALYRAAQALIHLERWDEAADVITRGKGLWTEGANQKVWETLGTQVAAGEKRAFERVERARRKELTDAARRAAVLQRGLVVLNTPEPPDNPHPLDFDPDALSPVPLSPPEVAAAWEPPTAATPLIFPVFLLYPQHNQSDLITHFHEETSFDDQLGPIFPAGPSSTAPGWSPWDQKHEYWTGNLVVYVETAARRLLKVGKEITLREVLAKAHRPAEGGKPRDGVVLRDGLLSFVVLVRGKEEREWIENFKRVRDGK